MLAEPAAGWENCLQERGEKGTLVIDSNADDEGNETSVTSSAPAWSEVPQRDE